MNDMTWNQFKEWVEERLKAENLDGDVLIQFIDFGFEPSTLSLADSIKPAINIF